MGRRSDIDWEKIERLYRLGQLSVRDIAKEAGVQASTITRRAQREGWTRDLRAQVQRETGVALLRSNATANATRNATAPTREDVEAAVQTNVGVIRSHRRDVAVARVVADTLLSQLSAAAAHREVIKAAILEATEAGPRRAAMMKAVSLPQHAATLRDLATAMMKFQGLERQAFNLDAAVAPETESTGFAAIMEAAWQRVVALRRGAIDGTAEVVDG